MNTRARPRGVSLTYPSSQVTRLPNRAPEAEAWRNSHPSLSRPYVFFFGEPSLNSTALALPPGRRHTEPISAGVRPQGIFGIPLRQSITYANVAISLVDENGTSYIYGYVPIVVAKCGVFLKEKGTWRCLSMATIHDPWVARDSV